MDNTNDKRVNDNLELLSEIKKEYDFDFVSQYSEFSNRVTRIEYSKGGIMNPYGYYSFDLLNELIITNYRRGKLYNQEVRGYNFKYSFEENQLIMIEKFDDGVKIDSFFIYHLNLEKIIIGYGSMKRPTYPKPAYLEQCLYDSDGRLKKCLSGLIIYEKMNNFEENLYEYSRFELKVKRFIYHQSVGATQFKDMVFPLSVLDEKTKIPTTKKVSCDTIKKILKDNWISIMQSWKIKNGYAISLILHDQMTIEIDYAEEDSFNQGPYSEQRWDYTYWNQNSFSLLKNDIEKNHFSSWLSQLEDKGIFTENLIENDIFMNIILSIIEELKRDEYISKTFGKKVPVIITTFDLGEEVSKYNRLANDEELIDGYFQCFSFL